MKFQNTIPIFVIFILISNFLNANDKFAPAIQVDDMLITHYEIQQRSAFFEGLYVFGKPPFMVEIHQININDQCGIK